MEASTGARLVKLLVFSLLFYASSGSNGQPLGYLYGDFSHAPHCYSLPNNTQCPPDLINHQIPEMDSGLGMAKIALTVVDFTVSTLDFFPHADDACRKSIRAYTCSNMFPVCRTDAQGIQIIAMNYNVTRTQQACATARDTCPDAALATTIFNCTNMMRDPRAFFSCETLPVVAGDVCPKTNYKYPKPSVQLYPKVAKLFKDTLSKMSGGLRGKCLKDFIKTTCQIHSGPICSDDGKQRMYVTSRQQCSRTIRRCLPGKAYFQKMCNLFPDGTTAKRVPLPSGVNNNMAG